MRSVLALMISMLALGPSVVAAQEYARTITYDLTIDAEHPGEAIVSMHVPAAGDTLAIAMAVHPEYDDRFYRYVRSVAVTRSGRPLPVVRLDSTVWRAIGDSGDAEVTYRVQMPGADRGRGSWRGFLTSRGGLIGGPHTFMYVLGRESSPVKITLHLPHDWIAVSGLASGPAPAFYARAAFETLDSPIMVGKLALWRFNVANVPHMIALWDTTRGAHVTPVLAGTLQRIADETRGVFGAFPYRRYTYLLVGGARGGGLEHRTSVSLGAPGDTSIAALTEFTEGAAHEYFHAWNEMALRPAGWGDVSHSSPRPNPLTWWMEGVTMYYADVIARRASAPVEKPDRKAALEELLSDYLDNPANVLISPDSASITSEMQPGANGNLAPDVYTQGRVLATLLDLEIHRRTSDKRSLDDAMRTLLLDRTDRGYDESDLIHAVESACHCDMSDVFARYVRTAHAIDLAAPLQQLGWRTSVLREPARDSAGALLADSRVYAYTPSGETRSVLVIENPDGPWARAGLRTGDAIERVDASVVQAPRDFLSVARTARIGDTIAVRFVRNGTQAMARVVMTAYERVRVSLTDDGVTPERLRSRALFLQAR